jgi:hypothetical protein
MAFFVNCFHIRPTFSGREATSPAQIRMDKGFSAYDQPLPQKANLKTEVGQSETGMDKGASTYGQPYLPKNGIFPRTRACVGS